MISRARAYINQSKPEVTTRAQDELFAMKPTKVHQVCSTPDFWWYLVSRMDAGDMAFESVVTQYYKTYLSKGLQFKEKSGPEDIERIPE
jgi:hypothetical protein